ncbi:MAG: hypothetical protein RID23_05510 [Roseovarius sp.]
MPRLIVSCLLALALCACTDASDLDSAPADLGDFHLGHNVVVAPKLFKGPFSRKASRAEWIAVMKAAVDERFGRYEGTRLYHLGISVDGYVLAQPGIPVVAAPKSLLILNVSVWDDTAGKKLNSSTKRITVAESFSADTVVGSGLTLSRDEQMQNLARNAAKQIEIWLRKEKRAKGWFENAPAPKPEAPSEPAPQPEPAPPEPVAEPAPEPPAQPIPEPVTEAAEGDDAPPPASANARRRRSQEALDFPRSTQ